MKSELPQDQANDHDKICKEALQYHGTMSRGIITQNKPIAFCSKLQVALKISYNNLSNTSTYKPLFFLQAQILCAANPIYQKVIIIILIILNFCKQTLLSLDDDFVHHSMFYVPELHWKSQVSSPVMTWLAEHGLDGLVWEVWMKFSYGMTLCSFCSSVRLCDKNFAQIFLFPEPSWRI